jgi:hypothetical protein
VSPARSPLARRIGRYLSTRRSLIGSDAVIACVILDHLIEAGLFLTTTTSNGSIGMHALLRAFRGAGPHQFIISAAMLASCLLAIVGQWGRLVQGWRRLLLLLPQETLLLITALGAALALMLGHYADGVIRPRPFILADQLPRLLGPIVYGAAMLARIRGGSG